MSRSQRQEALVDAYVHQLIVSKATQTPDDSLGAYVSSMLRTDDDQGEVLEFLREHCDLDAATAEQLLEEIVQVVTSGIVPAAEQSRAVSYPSSKAHNEQQHWAYQQDNPQVQHDDYKDEFAVADEWNHAVEVLLAYNPSVSQDACMAALSLVNVHVPAAHDLLQRALHAPPVCRHLLQDGCYRKDCQFSHNVTEHTCLFWMRGGCTKGGNCQFLHGFSSSTAHEVLAQWIDLPTEDPVEAWPKPDATTSAPAPAPSLNSFANIASRGFHPHSFRDTSVQPATPQKIPTVRIPVELWHAHENRDASVFYIADPLKRYEAVAATVRRSDILDLHFQSLSTFDVVLEQVLPPKLAAHETVWVVTGTGHHVAKASHQKKGATLEQSVLDWLVDHGYSVARGRDKNGQGGAFRVTR